MYTIFVVFVWIGAIPAVCAPLVYGLFNQWWKNYWGRTLMFKYVVFALVYLRSVIGILRPNAPRPDISPSILWITVLMGTALAANFIVLLVVTIKARRKVSVS